MPERTPLGGLHVRDFAPLREQRPFSDLTAGPDGYVRFGCLNKECARTGKILLADLQARFHADAGLVNVLNAIAPRDCRRRDRGALGGSGCGYCYRDLK